MVDFPTAHYISAPVYMIPSQPNWVLFALDDAEFKRNFSGSTELVSTTVVILVCLRALLITTIIFQVLSFVDPI